MKDAIYNNMLRSLKGFDNQEEAIKYYQYMLDNNPTDSTYPEKLREFHKGVIMGLKASIELRGVKQWVEY